MGPWTQKDTQYVTMVVQLLSDCCEHLKKSDIKKIVL